ncbi:NAD(P)-binding protein [Acephala macrosclerotiorum]|nr:NAD(P)-binding protein [Acephala macrosclerotiorum]
MNGSTAAANRAIIYADPPTIKTQVVELPIPEPGPGEVLVRLLYSGVCHTDYGICTCAFSTLPIPTPKGVGEVIIQGSGVKSPALGSKVGIKWAADACLNCGIISFLARVSTFSSLADNCLEGGETCCPFGTVSGYLTPGTFQQYCLAPAKYVTPIPEDMDLASAAALMCGGITVYTALKRAKLQHGQWVLISGAGGGLGHLAIQYAKALGAKVVAIDADSKRDFCLDLHADTFIDFMKHDSDASLAAEVKKITGKGARIALVCSSSNRAYNQAVSFLGFRGTLVCLGVPEGTSLPIEGAKVGDLIDKELTIFAIKSGNRLDAKECLEIAARGLVKTHYQLRKMESLTEIFSEMEDGKISGRMVLDLQ